MSGEREALAALLLAHDAERMECHDHLGQCCPTEGCAHGFKHAAEHQADAVLGSDWLAERDRRVRTEVAEAEIANLRGQLAWQGGPQG